jgi:hypothetical protein
MGVGMVFMDHSDRWNHYDSYKTVQKIVKQ